MTDNYQLRIVGLRPRPNVQRAIAADRQKALDVRIDRELARIRAERRAADDGESTFDEARRLLAEHGTVEAAIAHLLSTTTNGDKRGQLQRPVAEHGPPSRILGVK